MALSAHANEVMVEMKRIVMRALLLGGLSAHVAANAGITEHALPRAEGIRRYFMVDPIGPTTEKRPVIILLHGHGASAAFMVGRESFLRYKSEEWLRLAEREDVLLLAPDGSKASDGKRAWNDCRADAPTNATSDDVGFVAALIDIAIAQYNADPQRIYVFGSSNGGGMAYRLGIEIGPRLAAIAVQSALMPAQSRCGLPAHPLSVFVTHGTRDKIAPFGGGAVGAFGLHGRGSGISAEDSVAIWRKLAQLPGTPSTYNFPHRESSGATSATRFIWGADPAGMQVEFLRIDGGGHTAPSTSETLPWLLRRLLGDANHDVDTPSEVWDFLTSKRAAPAMER
jgi:polyhydroxybutyrate depolymerase